MNHINCIVSRYIKSIFIKSPFQGENNLVIGIFPEELLKFGLKKHHSILALGRTIYDLID